MPQNLFLSYTGLISILKSEDIVITDVELEGSLFYFGCHSALCKDIELFIEHFTAKEDVAIFNRLLNVFNKYPGSLLCKKDSPHTLWFDVNRLLNFSDNNIIKGEYLGYSNTPHRVLELMTIKEFKELMQQTNSDVQCIVSEIDYLSLLNNRSI